MLNLQPLDVRRRRGDLIQLYKIVNVYESVHWKNVDTFKFVDRNSRGHNKRMENELVKLCRPRYYFYTNRVIPMWNILSQSAVDATTINDFKIEIDKMVDIWGFGDCRYSN